PSLSCRLTPGSFGVLPCWLWPGFFSSNVGCACEWGTNCTSETLDPKNNQANNTAAQICTLRCIARPSRHGFPGEFRLEKWPGPAGLPFPADPELNLSMRLDQNIRRSQEMAALCLLELRARTTHDVTTAALPKD